MASTLRAEASTPWRLRPVRRPKVRRLPRAWGVLYSLAGNIASESKLKSCRSEGSYRSPGRFRITLPLPLPPVTPSGTKEHRAAACTRSGSCLASRGKSSSSRSPTSRASSGLRGLGLETNPGSESPARIWRCWTWASGSSRGIRWYRYSCARESLGTPSISKRARLFRSDETRKFSSKTCSGRSRLSGAKNLRDAAAARGPLSRAEAPWISWALSCLASRYAEKRPPGPAVRSVW
mmetsp:Transcript_23520/g.53058  ORF Transcript_23520/g.53058 Transcript_23520/m.53058 type:complete len:236 (-) Transcript_23520:525-1232(-)